jgi:hypothetical protein
VSNKEFLGDRIVLKDSVSRLRPFGNLAKLMTQLLVTPQCIHFGPEARRLDPTVPHVINVSTYQRYINARRSPSARPFISPNKPTTIKWCVSLSIIRGRALDGSVILGVYRRPQSAVPAFVMGTLCIVGGVTGYARTRSIPSIVAGIGYVFPSFVDHPNLTRPHHV